MGMNMWKSKHFEDNHNIQSRTVQSKDCMKASSHLYEKAPGGRYKRRKENNEEESPYPRERTKAKTFSAKSTTALLLPINGKA